MEDTTTTAAPAMKLSEAIRAGAALRPGIRGRYADYRVWGGADTCSGTCALGAAYEGITGKPPDTFSEDVTERLVDLFPVLTTRYTGDGNSDDWNLLDAIVHRNDYQDMTREQIADWLEAQGL